MFGPIYFEDLADFEGHDSLEDEGGLVVQHFQHDGVGPCFDQGQLRVGELDQDGLVPLPQQVDHFRVDSQRHAFLQTAKDLLVGVEDLVVDGHLELKALVEVAVGNDFDDDKGKGGGEVILAEQHALHFLEINPELLLTDLVVLLGHLPDVEAESLLIVNGKVDVDGKQTHEGQHYLLL